ncbi:MAG: CDGSH iron-sulfur domain-containing protein [Gammaproteobacteria bacterium]
MSTPVSPQKAPYGLDLDPGTYYWCACGRSRNQPFCDGSHQGTAFTPVQFTVDERKKLWLCGCKHTGTAPYCDGTHKNV